MTTVRAYSRTHTNAAYTLDENAFVPSNYDQRTLPSFHHCCRYFRLCATCICSRDVHVRGYIENQLLTCRSPGCVPGVMIQRAWVNPSFHFDSFSESFMTLFVVQTYKFVFIMQTSMDLSDFGASPQKNFAIHNALFFVCYVMVGGVFVMNLFVGFIVDGFNCNKGSSTTEIYYNRFMSQLKRYKPTYKYFSLPQNGVSVLCRQLIGNSLLCCWSMR